MDKVFFTFCIILFVVSLSGCSGIRTGASYDSGLRAGFNF